MFQPQRLSTQTTHSRKGVSLIELMTVMGLVGLIFTVLLALVGQSSALVSQGTQTIFLNQKARFAIDKMTPYLATAVANSSSPAIVAPNQKLDAPSAADLLSYASIQFTTTEDFLDPNYDPKTPYDLLNRPVFFYEIYFDKETSPISYTLEDGTEIELGRILLRKYQDSSFNTVDTTAGYHPIAFDVQYFHTHRLEGNTVEVIIHTVGKRKGPAGNQIDVFEQAQGIVDVPSPSYVY